MFLFIFILKSNLWVFAFLRCNLVEHYRKKRIADLEIIINMKLDEVGLVFISNRGLHIETQGVFVTSLSDYEKLQDEP